jgi:hypothetical protein
MSFKNIFCTLCNIETVSPEIIERCTRRHHSQIIFLDIGTFFNCIECKNIRLSSTLDNCGGCVDECPPKCYNTKAQQIRLAELNNHFKDFGKLSVNFLNNYQPLLNRINEIPNANNRKTNLAITDLIDLQNYIIDDRDI